MYDKNIDFTVYGNKLVYMIYRRFNSNEKAMNMNWCNQKTNPAVNTKMGNTKITNRQ